MYSVSCRQRLPRIRLILPAGYTQVFFCRKCAGHWGRGQKQLFVIRLEGL